MATGSKQVRIKRLEEDRNGMMDYIKLLQRNITDLEQRLLMARGALQYVNQLLGEKNGRSQERGAGK